MHEGDFKTLLASLYQAIAEIRQLEEEAGRLLYLRHDKAGYRQKMVQKTTLLIELPQRTASCLTGLDPALRQRVEAKLRRFAGSAARARELESIFYMSALLYPEDHREGDPNDLERLVVELEKEKKRINEWRR